jgi:microcystin-dependent protein
VADPFVGEIRPFAFNFPPKGWAKCDGQLLPLSQNTALFSLLGTTYGGDGKTNFALPNLQGSSPLHPGQGPGLTGRSLGEAAGEQSLTLLASELPAHTHPQPQASTSERTTNRPGSGVPAKGGAYASGSDANSSWVPAGPVGGDQPHSNLQPYLTTTFCIALQGVFPPRP